MEFHDGNYHTVSTHQAPASNVLTLARKPCFATFAGVGGWGGATPLGVSKPSVIELREKTSRFRRVLAICGIIFGFRSMFDPVMTGQRSNFRKFHDFLVSRVHISKTIDRSVECGVLMHLG